MTGLKQSPQTTSGCCDLSGPTVPPPKSYRMKRRTMAHCLWLKRLKCHQADQADQANGPRSHLAVKVKSEMNKMNGTSMFFLIILINLWDLLH